MQIYRATMQKATMLLYSECIKSTTEHTERNAITLLTWRVIFRFHSTEHRRLREVFFLLLLCSGKGTKSLTMNRNIYTGSK